MLQIKSSSVSGTEGITANTKCRDASFVMTGHHCHDCYELFYVHGGECRFLVDDDIHDLGAGDFILIPPRVLHYTRFVFGECTRTVILFRGEEITEDIRQLMPGGEKLFAETALFRAPAACRTQVENSLAQVVSETETRDIYSASISRCALQSLMLLCARFCVFLPETAGTIVTTDPQVLQAVRFISGHYMDPITTLDVARAVGFSPNYLSRKFRAAAGIGLHEYIVFMRLHHAAEELVSTVDSVTTIALRSGFSDSNYFKDSFKKKYGVTPRQYRKMA